MMNIVGVDEVGRGCMAGPLVVAGVVLPEYHSIEGLRDSKLLSEIQRRKLAVHIRQTALAIGIGWIDANIVDSLGLTKATSMAINQVLNTLSLDYDTVLIDGNYDYLPTNDKSRNIINGDATIPCISAASIIAKVSRDEYMRQLDKKYPLYGFGRHVGYCTKEHIRQLTYHGVSDLHRKSFRPVAKLLVDSV
jgi:ribonuclease HII